MPAQTSHLQELVEKKWFTSLVDEEDVSNIEQLSEYTEFASNAILTKNFTTGEKTYFVSMQGSPIFFKQFNYLNNKLLDRLQLYLMEFDSEDLSTVQSELFFFDSTLIENSYDSSSIARDSIKTIFDAYYSCDEEFLTNTLDVFDGGTASFVDGIRIHKKENCNTALCYELGTNAEDRSFERNSRVFKDIALLYGLKESLVDEWIEKYKPILYNKNTRICYQLKHSETGSFEKFEVLILPISSQVFMTAHNESIQSFLELGLINQDQANDLKDWNDYTFRVLSHFNLILTEGTSSLNTELQAFYGIELDEKINPPYRPVLSLEDNPEETGGEYYPETWNIGKI